MNNLLILVGIIICAISWLYNRQVEHNNSLMAIEDYLSELSKIMQTLMDTANEK